MFSYTQQDLKKTFHQMLCIFVIFSIVQFHHSAAIAQEGAWEYEPYRMQMWLSIDPAIQLEDSQAELLLEHVREQTELVYNATARVDCRLTPRSLMSQVLRELDGFSIKQVLASEMVLAVTKNNPGAKDFRTFDNILEKAEAIFLTKSNAALMNREMKDDLHDEVWKKMASKFNAVEATSTELLAQLKSGEIPIALIRKSELESLGRNARLVPTRFPWQMDSLLKSRDKIFAVSLTSEMELIRVQIREIDCLMRVVGPRVETTISSLEMLPRSIAFATQKAFAPMARVEEADVSTVKMRTRAGGLIMEDEPDHPGKIVSGDVLVPYIRRDDRNGIPTLLQTLPWSYIAVASGNDIDIEGAVFSGIRGALAGRKNKRTKKVGLKARLVSEGTDLHLNVARMPGLVVAGAEVYRRTPGSDDLTLVGRSDWRGVVHIDEKSLPKAYYDPPVQKAKANAEGGSGEKPIAEAKPEKPEKASIDLKFPLYLYYIKNGNTLLAKLPLMTGLELSESAELPDDRRRLEAEAFIKGIQGEVLDLVARRKILDSRIRSRISGNNKKEAEELLGDLRKEKSYDKMQEELDALQRRILSSERGPITAGSQIRIDKMFDSTRQMLQKYLQDNLLRDLEVLVLKMSS